MSRSRPFVRISALAALVILSANVVGCSSTKKVAAEPDPAAVAKAQAEKAERAKMRDEARTSFQQARDDVQEAKAEAAALQRKAASFEASAAADERKADACRMRAADFEWRGDTNLLAGFWQSEMFDRTDGPATTTSGEEKLAHAKALRALADTLDTGAVDKRDHATSLREQADQQLAHATSRTQDARRFASMFDAFSTVE